MRAIDNGEVWPEGLDLRDFIFDEGLPPGAYEVDSPAAFSGESLFGAFGEPLGNGAFLLAGFGAEPSVKLPPFPKLDNPAGIRAYLAESWRLFSLAYGSFGTTADAPRAWSRLRALPTAKTASQAVADCITAGPLPGTKGAKQYYSLAKSMQAMIATKTKQAPVAATPGTMAAAIAHGIASAAQSNANAARDIVSKTTGAARDTAASVARAAQSEADKTRQTALAAITSITDIPKTFFAKQAEAVDSITSVPKTVITSATSVPKHIADKVSETVQSYVAAAKEIMPEVTANLAEGAKGAGMGIATVGIGVIGVTGLVGVVAAGIYFGPEIAAMTIAKGKGRK